MSNIKNILQPANTKQTDELPFFVTVSSLNKLNGPYSGDILLPKRLLWNPSRSFNLTDEKRTISMIRVVLREARKSEDIEQYVNREQLIKLWDKLNLPQYIKQAWEQKFPELTDHSHVHDILQLADAIDDIDVYAESNKERVLKLLSEQPK